ncbi:hypothetical protein F9L33_13930 [Amylibacter sp. SFDW26]|uniref:hypothetical protein n=1 Tax=Amylibacter sp. SFDW26 TaxID=2652722 RepID=UPI0012613F1F|nr:hypothetical protein [Amylibacter sp. SFDW26]KAB7610396.1 hypothetical protein F9L33_13930 [Amylibacter sp. SFDW26]
MRRPMRQNVKYKFFNILISIVLSLSIVGIGFGHRAGTINEDQAIQEYILSGGSVWDICGDPSQNGSQVHTQCEACRLVDALGLAQFTCLPQKHEYEGISLASLRASLAGAVQHVSNDNPVRGPPTLL